MLRFTLCVTSLVLANSVSRCLQIGVSVGCLASIRFSFRRLGLSAQTETPVCFFACYRSKMKSPEFAGLSSVITGAESRPDAL
jgi:hypothetical protein